MSKRNDNEPDWGLYVRFKRTETFDGEGKYESSTCHAKVSWHRDNRLWRFDKEQNKRVYDHEKDSRLFARLHHRLLEDFGLADFVTTEDEHPGVDVTMLPDKTGIDIMARDYADRGRLDQVMGIVQGAAGLWRRGELGVAPKVRPEDHAEMVEHGIKVRRDGLFGYKRRCANEKCENRTRTCYASTTLRRAIDGAQTRSIYSCSTMCVVAVHGLEGVCADWVEALVVDPPTIDAEGNVPVVKRVLDVVGKPRYVVHPEHNWVERPAGKILPARTWCSRCGESPDEAEGEECLTHELEDEWLKAVEDGLPKSHPDLFVEWVDYLMQDNEGYASEGDAVSCEV